MTAWRQGNQTIVDVHSSDNKTTRAARTFTPSSQATLQPTFCQRRQFQHADSTSQSQKKLSSKFSLDPIDVPEWVRNVLPPQTRGGLWHATCRSLFGRLHAGVSVKPSAACPHSFRVPMPPAWEVRCTGRCYCQTALGAPLYTCCSCFRRVA